MWSPNIFRAPLQDFSTSLKAFVLLSFVECIERPQQAQRSEGTFAPKNLRGFLTATGEKHSAVIGFRTQRHAVRSISTAPIGGQGELFVAAFFNPASYSNIQSPRSL